MIFDVDNLGDDFALYSPSTGQITVYLANIYHDMITKHDLTENYLIYKIIDHIIHEQIHRAIDDCIEGNPEEVDDHKIYKYLVGV